MLELFVLALLGYGGLLALVAFGQRRLLYFPSHEAAVRSVLTPWTVEGKSLGAHHVPAAVSEVWLMTHGNAGQAAHRAYVLPLLAQDAALYVLEYPGYGEREGSPSRAAFDAAAFDAYTRLRALHPGAPIGVLGESIGSGPAAALARASPPPDRVVLVVPFARLADVAADAFPWLPVRWLLRDRWDNVADLADYRGPVEVLAAKHDTIIPAKHARALAAALPGATLRELDAGHNDWSQHVVGPLRVR
jgi:pimeloyl-ACP methyl ester carboxylesterase